MTPNRRVHFWRQRLSCISLSVLSLALLTVTPALATTKADKANSEDSESQSDTKAADSKTSSKTAAKTKAAKTAKSHDTVADNDSSDSDKPVKSKTTAKATASKSKATKLADSDDESSADKPAKSKTTAKTSANKAKATKLADADDDDSGDTSKKSSKSSKDLKSSKSKATALADNSDDESSAKSKSTKSSKSQTTAKLRTRLAEADDASESDSSDSKKTHGSDKTSSKDKASSKSKKNALADSDSDSSASDDDSKPSKAHSKHGASTELASLDEQHFPNTPRGRRAREKAKARAAAKAAALANAALSAGLAKAALTMATPSQLALTRLHVTTPGQVAVMPTAIPVALVGSQPVAQPITLNAAPVPYMHMASAMPVAVSTTPGVLSAADSVLYQTAFSQIDQGDFYGVEATLAQVSDKSLIGYVEYHKLFNRNYTASYDELTAWLGQYGDQPMAMKVWDLAKRKKPVGAPDPAFPQLMGAQATASTAGQSAIAGVNLVATTTLSSAPKADINPGAPVADPADSDLTPKSARSAYNNGQMEQAVALANKIGDHWVAGLANWRLKRYDKALIEFKFVSTDLSRNAWSQSSGAYWAGRCADKLNNADQAQTFYKYAATFPFTFYGLLAEAKLGVTPAVALAKKGKPPTYQPDQREVLTASLNEDFSWTKSDVPAQRLSALVQLGRTADAQDEAQFAVQRASDPQTRDRWLALAASDHVEVSQMHGNDRLFDASIYPVPQIKLKGGYKIDRALLFAFARKESKFNTNAKSYSGAYGLLQLMPGTAALVENDPSFNEKPQKLLQPAINMRVGQDYILRLKDSKIVGGDLLRTIAAYNAGPRPVKDATDSLGADADSLLVMESIPVAQTREYVEEVAASYWIYRQILGQSSKSLTQATQDATIIDVASDN